MDVTSVPELGKEKLYMVSFKGDPEKSVPIVAESPEGVREIIAREGKYDPETIDKIEFKQSYYAWDYKQVGVYGPSGDDWDLLN